MGTVTLRGDSCAVVEIESHISLLMIVPCSIKWLTKLSWLASTSSVVGDVAIYDSIGVLDTYFICHSSGFSSILANDPRSPKKVAQTPVSDVDHIDQ